MGILLELRDMTAPTGTLQIVYRRLDELAPADRNAKEHATEELERSLGRFGFVDPVTPDERTGKLLAGHGRHETVTELHRRQPASPPRGIVVDDDGMWKIPTIAGVRSRDDVDAEALGIALNAIQERGGWRTEILTDILEDLHKAPAQLDGVGFDLDALDDLITGRNKPDPAGEEPRPDDVDIDKPDNPFSKPGDLWQLGEHRLLVGDATDPEIVDRLFAGADPAGELLAHAALIFTDPPYGVSYEDSQGRSIDGDDLRRDALLGLLAPSFTLAAQHATDTAAFYIWHASSTRRDFEDAMRAAGLEERQYLIWVKPSIVPGRSHYRWAHEPCFYAAKAGVTPAWYGDKAQPTTWRIHTTDEHGARTVAIGPGLILTDGGGAELFISSKPPKRKLRAIRAHADEVITLTTDGPGDAWEIARDTSPTGNPAIHPNQKPVELARRALRNSSRPGDIVYDPFAGSGSTIIAAEELGRRCFALELDPAYADLIIARWQRATEGTATRHDGETFPGIGER